MSFSTVLGRRVEGLVGGAVAAAPRYGRATHMFLFTLTLFGACLLPSNGFTQTTNEECLDCHDDTEFTTERAGREISLHVEYPDFLRSTHGELQCVDCHTDANDDHEERLQRVRCGTCHDDVQLDFDASIHGQALNRQAPHAPDCGTCHGAAHTMHSPTDPESPAYKMKVPYLCGRCHQEGAPVASTYNIGEHNIIENYSQSIHGEGLFKKGLVVTATCTNCHSSHLILPHTEPRSSVSPRNIAVTCMACHSRIEDVHEQVIRGELWEKSPGAIPACTDCHLPHKVRKEVVGLTISDRDCLKCHEKPDVFKMVGSDTLSLQVDKRAIDHSVHTNIPCVKCHSDIDPRRHRPCETATTVDCAGCHAKISDEYYASGHGQAHLAGTEQAPYCTTCHGDHDTKPHSDDTSPSYRAQVPELCGRCHGEGMQAVQVADLSEEHALADYSKSVHGRGLTEKGLLPSAICIDCHSSHLTLSHTDERSTVNENNIAATCATCHRGIYKDYIKSVHFSGDPDSEKELPNCTHCHSSHTIATTERDQFMTEVTHQCGSCHQHLAETYLETMHGKVYTLGDLNAAKCSDCHGAHAILGHNDPNSSVGFRNLVGTCQQCHPDANQRFTGYLTHATHHDPVRYPILYYTYWAMTGLLVGVFSFFGLHTLMWLPRSFKMMRERRKNRKEEDSRYFIRRFSASQRWTHFFVIITFLTLALTGMMLKFSGVPWTQFVAKFFGGVRNAGVIHRIAAVMTFGYFIFHLIWLARFKHRRRLTLLQLVFGKDSLMFNKKDIQDFVATVKWFLGGGPQPRYGRWTYWEKFDYFAVFWGVALIGLSGLMLWFPELFTKLIPGWLINVATIIHSDEALLAVGFIFTIHFFNTHLRPEVFPMDTVIFTGVTPFRDYKHERPEAIESLKARDKLRKHVVTMRISRRRAIAIRVFGYTALTIGLVLVGLIIYSVLFGYQ
jgi:cytochrome b subunit of formate dehydrogenase